MDRSHTSYSQTPVPRAILAHFLRQIQAHHCRTPAQSPLPLHYDPSTQTLQEFAWPFDTETGQRVPPSMLESYRRTHYFRGPSCLCAFLDNTNYTESLIGIVEVARGDADGNHDSVLNGQYVAVCERRRCGYSLCLEKFYTLSSIKVKACHKRESPLPPQALNYISDLQGLAQPHGQAGLLQVISEPTIRGKGRSCFPLIKPEVPKMAKRALLHSLVYGMNEELFWDTFVQCFVCKDIMLRLGMFSSHRCHIDTGLGGEQQPHTPMSATAGPHTTARLHRAQGDIPATRPMRSMSARFSSPTPTEVASDYESEASDHITPGSPGPSRFQGALEADSEFDEDPELPSLLELLRGE